MKAEFESLCSKCLITIQVGQGIKREGNEWVHQTCPKNTRDQLDNEAMKHPICPVCMTRHPGEC